MHEAMSDELNCKVVRDSLWEFAAGRMDESELNSVESHLGVCRECASQGREVRSLRFGLKQLPSIPVPAMVTTKLLINASRERSRRLGRQNFGQWLKLFFENLFKPFAVPAAGGMLASFLCFGVLIEGLQVSAHWNDAMPLGAHTEIAINELTPFCFGGRDVMFQLTVDEGGNVVDYMPQSSNPSPEEMREIGNLVLYSTFTPATRFGQAISSKRLFLHSHISVKG